MSEAVGTARVRDVEVELNELGLEDESPGNGAISDESGDFQAVRTDSFETQEMEKLGGDLTSASAKVEVAKKRKDEILEDEVIPGNSGKLGASFNFVNSIVGAGIIGLPFALRECGFVMGIVLIVVVSCFTWFSVSVLIKSGVEVKRRSYEGLCEYCFGWMGFKVVSFFMLVFAFGAMCAYLVIVGDTLPVVFKQLFGKELSRDLVIFLFALFIILPLSLLRDMAKLSWSSSLSISADGLIVILVLARASYGAENWPLDDIEPDFSFANPTLFAGLGAISFAFVCQHSSFIVFNTLREPTTSSWRVVNVSSVATAGTMSLALALTGYLAFFQQTRANVLNNFSCEDDAINVARLMLALTMIFTYPMEIFVTRHSLFCLIFGYSPTLEGTRQMPIKWHIGITIGLWFLSLIVGLTVTDLGIILELTGAFSASMLGFILPAMCWFKVFSFMKLWNTSRKCWNPTHPLYRSTIAGKLAAARDFYLPLMIWIFGVIALVAGTTVAIINSGRGGNDHKCLEYEV